MAFLSRETRERFLSTISHLTGNEKTIPVLCILVTALHSNSTDDFAHSLAKRLCVYVCACMLIC